MFQHILTITISILIAAAGISLFRLFRGPSFPDRILALDLLATLVVGMTGLLAVWLEQAIYMRAGIVLALVSFLGTVAYTYYLSSTGKTK